MKYYDADGFRIALQASPGKPSPARKRQVTGTEFTSSILKKTARVNFTYVWPMLLRKLNHKYESFCANIRQWQNNCLVPVTYCPESQVGRSEKYFILDKNFKSPVINLPGKMTSAKFESLTSFTHTHTECSWQHAILSLSKHGKLLFAKFHYISD